MSHDKHLPDTVSASLEARLAPFPALAARESPSRTAARTAASGVEGPARNSSRPEPFRTRFVDGFKLLYAALGAGGRVVPMGDNGRTARQFAEYAGRLQQPC